MSPTHGESVVRLLSHHLQTPQPVAERGNHTGARPSESSPSIPDTPNTGNSSLPTDDELDSGTPKFRYSNPDGAMYHTLENIPEKVNTNNGRDNGKADRSGSDDDVFKIDGVSDTGSKDIGPGRKRKDACASRAGADEDTVTRVNQSPILVNNVPHGSDSKGSHHVEEDEPEMERLLPNKPNYTPSKVSHKDLSNQEWQRELPNSAPPGDSHREIRGGIVYVIVRGNAQFGFHSHVEDFQVGDREINNNYLSQDVTDSRHDTFAFNRSSSERQTC